MQAIVAIGQRGYCGFRGGGFNGAPYKVHHCTLDVISLRYQGDAVLPYNYSHITMTYTALAILITLGDDLSRVDKAAVISSLRHLQLDNGR